MARSQRGELLGSFPEKRVLSCTSTSTIEELHDNEVGEARAPESSPADAQNDSMSLSRIFESVDIVASCILPLLDAQSVVMLASTSRAFRETVLQAEVSWPWQSFKGLNEHVFVKCDQPLAFDALSRICGRLHEASAAVDALPGMSKSSLALKVLWKLILKGYRRNEGADCLGCQKPGVQGSKSRRGNARYMRAACLSGCGLVLSIRYSTCETCEERFLCAAQHDWCCPYCKKSWSQNRLRHCDGCQEPVCDCYDTCTDACLYCGGVFCQGCSVHLCSSPCLSPTDSLKTVQDF